MKILVRDRRQGKTTELIKWMLEGNQQLAYPAWSRVIVCVSHRMVIYTTDMLRDYIKNNDWKPRDDQRLDRGYDLSHDRLLTDVRKGVWSLDDLTTNFRGSRPFEYAIDDLDHLLIDALHLRFAPEVATMSGELVDDLCD
jgi:hypothetical protein